jgi:hypothetical protein
VLALVVLLSATYSRLLRAGLALGTLFCFALSLGLPSVQHPDRGLTIFRLLHDFAPGWNGVRTPGRINNLTSLGLALLAAAGLTLIVRGVRRLSGANPSALVSAALVAAILAEGFGPIPHAHVPPRPTDELAGPAPQLHLPTIVGLDGIYAYWSIGSFPTMANAASSFDPRVISTIRRVSKRFPDAGSVRLYRRLGIRTIILHRQLARGTPWQHVPVRSTAGLDLTRRIAGNLIVYQLGT